MKSTYQNFLISLFFVLYLFSAYAQTVQLGDAFFISDSELKKGISDDQYKSYIINDLTPVWSSVLPGTDLALFHADRGTHEGTYLLTCMVNGNSDKSGVFIYGNPFGDEFISSKISLNNKPSDFLSRPDAYTKYELIGADRAAPLPEVGILGLHFLKVKKDRHMEFESFVLNKLHPAVTNLFLDMGLFYYKAVGGENSGSYILVFAITSLAARDKYWPSGKPETEILKSAFGKLQGLAKELGTYLEEDSYLKPESGGAAAYFESLDWTDYILVK